MYTASKQIELAYPGCSDLKKKNHQILSIRDFLAQSIKIHEQIKASYTNKKAHFYFSNGCMLLPLRVQQLFITWNKTINDMKLNLVSMP